MCCSSAKHAALKRKNKDTKYDELGYMPMHGKRETDIMTLI
jgi:hypothetical protein